MAAAAINGATKRLRHTGEYSISQCTLSRFGKCGSYWTKVSRSSNICRQVCRLVHVMMTPPLLLPGKLEPAQANHVRPLHQPTTLPMPNGRK
jgi:hypothetical protein